ncbi:MAG: acyl-CoA desaturase [Novosphingobium sp.]
MTSTGFLIDGWASARPSGIRGMNLGGSLGGLRTGSNVLQQLIVHGGTAWAFVLAWQRGVTWIDLTSFALFYALTGLGASLGLHRLFSHRSFEAVPWLHAALAVLASMCMQGSPARWATDHQRHHAYSDRPGDPHSPHVGPLGERLSKWRGLYHAHWGWMFNGVTTDKAVFGRQTWGDPVLRRISNTHYLWIAAGLALAWLYGWLLGGTREAALTAMLWGGPVRACLMMHGVLSATSIAHRFGDKQFRVGDESRNNWIVVLLTFGDGWHNNHHRFPRSARHGLLPAEIDISGSIIDLFERAGLVRNVVRIPPPQVQSALASGPVKALQIRSDRLPGRPGKTGRNLHHHYAMQEDER